MNEPDLRHAIRHAIPKLSAIADDIAGFSTTQLERATAAEELFSVVADLLSALDGHEDASGPTTAQEGQEGRSGQMSGVSGETVRQLCPDCVPCWPCGQPVHVERLDNGKTYTTDPDGLPHTCHPSDIHENRRTPYRPQEST